MTRRLLLGSILAATTALVPTPSAALCGGPPPIDEAIADPEQIVFVGTVARTEDDDAEALFHVEEVWSGPDLPEWLWVDGTSSSDPGPLEPMRVVAEDSRPFATGVRYLAFPYNPMWPDGGELERFGSVADSMCSNTQPWDEALAGLRPADVRSPFAVTEPSTTVPVPLLVAGAGVVVLATVGFVAFRRRRLQ